MDHAKEKNMEKLINNAPFALVLVFLVIGFVLLIKGADFFVEGSSSVAKRLHVPSIIIGLTIVAMGTSLPETAVSVSASITGNNELAVSNVVGSNIFNLMVVIGVCAMIATVEVARETIRRDIPLSLICAGLLLLLGTMGLGDQANMTLGHFDGVIFIGLFAFDMSRMKIQWYFFGTLYDDILRKSLVQRIRNFLRRHPAGRVKHSDIPQCMHTGICPAGTDDLNRLPQQIGQTPV